MNGEASPMNGEASPMNGEASPMNGEASPMNGEGINTQRSRRNVWDLGPTGESGLWQAKEASMPAV